MAPESHRHDVPGTAPLYKAAPGADPLPARCVAAQPPGGAGAGAASAAASAAAAPAPALAAGRAWAAGAGVAALATATLA
jgi:hypothetical protein